MDGLDPFHEEVKASLADKARKMANALIILLGADVTESQRDAFVKVMAVVLVEHPWVLKAPAVREWLK